VPKGGGRLRGKKGEAATDEPLLKEGEREPYFTEEGGLAGGGHESVTKKKGPFTRGTPLVLPILLWGEDIFPERGWNLLPSSPSGAGLF